MKKKLIITITNNISFDQRINRIATSLSEDFEVTVIGTCTRNPPPLKSEIFKQIRINTLFKSGKFFYVEFNVRLLLLLWFKKFDIVYSVDLDTLLVGSILKSAKGIKLVFDSHEYFTELPEIINRPFVQKIWKKVAKFGIPKANLCITVNYELSEILANEYKSPFNVIRNMPVLSNELLSNGQSQILIYQGALNVGRGIEYMILSMKELPDYSLKIAGNGPLRKEFEALTEKNGLKNVEFLGMIEPNKLKSITRECTLGLNLLEGSSKNYYYSLANKFFDYVEAGVPSINMNFPVYASLNKKNEVSALIDEGILPNLGLYLKELLSNQNTMQRMKSNCLVARMEWNWEMEEVRLLEMLSFLK